MEAGDEAARQALQIKIAELRELEACERGLAIAYRRRAWSRRKLGRLDARQIERIALRHFEHAALLHGRVTVLGGQASGDADEAWVSGSDAAALRRAETHSLAVYHDHLTDLDEPSAHLIELFILPDHEEARAALGDELEPPSAPR